MKWKDRSPREKLLRITELIVSAVILLAAILKYMNIWPDGLMFAIPLLGVLQLLNAILHWKTDRDLAAYHLIVAGFICLVCIGVFCM